MQIGGVETLSVTTFLYFTSLNPNLLNAKEYFTQKNIVYSTVQYSPVQCIVQEKQATMVFKALNNLTPDYIYNLFKPTCTNTNHSLRSKTSNKLHVPAAHHKRP